MLQFNLSKGFVLRGQAQTCLAELPPPGEYAAIVLAVGHREFIAMGELGIRALGVPEAVLFDVKGILPNGAADARL